MHRVEKPVVIADCGFLIGECGFLIVECGLWNADLLGPCHSERSRGIWGGSLLWLAAVVEVRQLGTGLSPV